MYSKKVDLFPWDTGKTLYQRLISESVKTMDIVADLLHNRPLAMEATKSDHRGTYHCSKDFEELKVLDLEEQGSLGSFLDRLRALSFPPYKNAYFIDERGKKVFVEVSLTPEDDLK